MIPPIFQDPDHQSRFDRDGFIVLPLLDAKAVKGLRDYFASIMPHDPEHGFFSSTFSPDIPLKQAIYAQAQAWFRPKVEAIFKDWKPLGASYLLKKPGNPGAMPIHQDWTVTDELRWRTMTVWVPLQDVDANTGAIKVLPGSHRFSNALRGPTLPVIWRDVMHVLEPRMQSLPMSAGSAFIFDHAVLHSSHLHQGAQARLAMTFGLTHASTELCYYHRDAADTDPDRLERFAVPDDFFLQYHQIGQRPGMGTSTGFVRQSLAAISPQECEELLSGARKGIFRPIQDLSTVKAMPKAAPAKPGFFKRLFSRP